MEHLNLPSVLILVWDLQRALEHGQSIHVGLQRFVSRKIQCEFSQQFRVWVSEAAKQHQTAEKHSIITPAFKITQRPLIDLIRVGLSGVGVYQSLKQIEKEYITQCEDDIQSHVAKLPLLLQIPLMGLLFPAILCLLVLPALRLLQM